MSCLAYIILARSAFVYPKNFRTPLNIKPRFSKLLEIMYGV